jgi:alkylation response protein AidB-like acyl-CoA dehydrogenase
MTEVSQVISLPIITHNSIVRLYVHDTLFFESIYAQGTTEQFQHWKTAMLRTECLGCFAMTGTYRLLPF